MFDETHANPHWRKAIPLRNMLEALHGEIKSQPTQKNSQLTIGYQKITLKHNCSELNKDWAMSATNSVKLMNNAQIICFTL